MYQRGADLDFDQCSTNSDSSVYDLRNRGHGPVVEDALVELQSAIEGVPVVRFGYRPKFPSFLTLFTSMFMHAGWMHLLGNMLFLWLAVSVIEDTWGRGRFIGLYLLTGCVAVMGHHLLAPDSAIPLVGASCAISGMLGAFLFGARDTEVRLFYLFWILRPYIGTTHVHAWFAIPLWFVIQVVWLLVDSNSGVSYIAHVSGFVAGVAASWFADSRGWIDTPPPPAGSQPLFIRTPQAKLPTTSLRLNG